jgi:hypothetical protein
MLQTGQHRITADYPAPHEADWIARDFRFNTGEVMSKVRLHYRTIGDPSGEPVLVLHGTTGTGASMPTPDFAGELFGPGQPLDTNKYSSSFRMRWGPVDRPSRLMDCAHDSRLTLRRHGARAAPASNRASEHPAPATIDR